MIKSLLARLTDICYEYDGALWVEAIERAEDDIHIFLAVHVTEQPDFPPRVLLKARYYEESNLVPRCYSNISHESDHVLLWHYNKPHAIVSFYGETPEPLAVVGALVERHIELVGDWIPFPRYLNMGHALSQLIGGRYGMLAHGPKRLVLAYEEVMQRYGFSTAHHESLQPRPQKMSLLMFDERFVIAREFEATPI